MGSYEAYLTKFLSFRLLNSHSTDKLPANFKRATRVFAILEAAGWPIWPIVLASVIALQLLDASVNTMTLGGMAIATGALVDDAIIDVENVFRRLRENAALPPEGRRPALEVVYRASVEIRSSIVFATAIIVLGVWPRLITDLIDPTTIARLGGLR